MEQIKTVRKTKRQNKKITKGRWANTPYSDSKAYTPKLLGNRLALKYPGVDSKEVESILYLACKEMQEIVLNEKASVFLPYLFFFNLAICRKRGYDFTLGKQVERNKWYKLNVKQAQVFKVGRINRANLDFGYIDENGNEISDNIEEIIKDGNSS